METLLMLDLEFTLRTRKPVSFFVVFFDMLAAEKSPWSGKDYGEILKKVPMCGTLVMKN